MRKKPRRKGLLKPLAWANLLFLGGVWLVGDRVAERTPWTTVVAYLPQPAYFVPAVLLAAAMFVSFRWRLLVGHTAATLVFAWVLLGFELPERTGPAGKTIRVLTYNIHHAFGGWEKVRETILAEKPDVFLVQEANHYRRRLPDTGEIPGYHIWNRGGMAVGSLKPIDRREEIVLPGNALPILEVETGGLTVVNVHMASFPSRAKMLSEPGLIPPTFFQVARHHERLARAILERYGDRDRVVMAGDFNGPPRGRVYGLLRSRFDDAFARSGFGFGYTFSSEWPVQRIDYVWTRGMRPIRTWVPGSRASDHRPVVADLATE